jgi:hypothetical protein
MSKDETVIKTLKTVKEKNIYGFTPNKGVILIVVIILCVIFFYVYKKLKN